jgi:hypothetical protein
MSDASDAHPRNPSFSGHRYYRSIQTNTPNLVADGEDWRFLLSRSGPESTDLAIFMEIAQKSLQE